MRIAGDSVIWDQNQTPLVKACHLEQSHDALPAFDRLLCETRTAPDGAAISHLQAVHDGYARWILNIATRRVALLTKMSRMTGARGRINVMKKGWCRKASKKTGAQEQSARKRLAC